MITMTKEEYQSILIKNIDYKLKQLELRINDICQRLEEFKIDERINFHATQTIIFENIDNIQKRIDQIISTI